MTPDISCEQLHTSNLYRSLMSIVSDSFPYLGMQFGGVLSTSQVANSFMGTGLAPETEVISPASAAAAAEAIEAVCNPADAPEAA